MKKRFFRWAVMLTALSVALSFASCGDDDDEEEPKQEQTDPDNGDEGEPQGKTYEFKNNKIAVEAGKSYVYSLDKENVDGEFTVTAAKAGEVSLTIEGNAVTLSDAGTSYLSINFEGIGQKVAESNPENVLFMLASGSTNISSPKNAKSTIIQGGDDIFFAEK